jgi:CelD/BcsL family acetyltransferase involved in cellulose biosynthesis
MRVQTGRADMVRTLAEDWRRLCGEDPACEPFYRPEWTEAFLLAFAPAATLTVVSAWSSGRLRGVLPLIRERGFVCGFPVRRITFPANAHCCRAGVVSCPGTEGEKVLREMWRTLKMLGGWDVLDLNYVVEGNGVEHLASLAEADGFRVAKRRVWQSLFVPMTSSGDGQASWQASLRPSFRSALRRRRRQLEELGQVTLRNCQTAAPEALEQFYRVEGSGWKGRQGTAIAGNPKTRRFYDVIGQALARNGHLALDFLELDGQPVAAHFAVTFNGRYLLAKAGYDEAYQRCGPGHLLVHEILNQSGPRGLRELDFVGPAAWDETRWASQRRNHLRVFIFRNNGYGSWLHALRITAREAVKNMLGRGAAEKTPE